MAVRLRHDSHQPVVGFPSAVAILPLRLDRTNETCTDYGKLIPQGSMPRQKKPAAFRVMAVIVGAFPWRLGGDVKAPVFMVATLTNARTSAPFLRQSRSIVCDNQHTEP